MVFIYKYRNADGGLVVNTIHATGRIEAFKILRNKGISPISLEAKQAGNVSKSPLSVEIQQRSFIKRLMIISGCVVFAVAVIVIIINTYKPETQPKQMTPIKANSSGITHKPKVEIVSSNSNTTQVIAPLSGSERINMALAQYRELRDAGKISFNKPNTNNLVIVRRPGAPDPVKVFPHRGNRIINKILHLRPGDRVIGNPIPPHFDEAFHDAIQTPIEFTDEDTDITREMKENVIAARTYIQQEMERRNVSASTILEETIAELRESAETRVKLLKTLAELKHEGATMSELRDTLKDANTVLREMVPGAREIQMISVELDEVKETEE